MAVAPRLTIGTRGSPLALAQAFETKRLLSQAFHELADDSSIEIKKIMTKVPPSYLFCMYTCCDMLTFNAHTRATVY